MVTSLNQIPMKGLVIMGHQQNGVHRPKTHQNILKTYSKSGNLFYIIDKSKDVGDFFKIALHKKWTGEEEWYDRADNQIEESNC